MRKCLEHELAKQTTNKQVRSVSYRLLVKKTQSKVHNP